MASGGGRSHLLMSHSTRSGGHQPLSPAAMVPSPVTTATLLDAAPTGSVCPESAPSALSNSAPASAPRVDPHSPPGPPSPRPGQCPWPSPQLPLPGRRVLSRAPSDPAALPVASRCPPGACGLSQSPSSCREWAELLSTGQLSVGWEVEMSGLGATRTHVGPLQGRMGQVSSWGQALSVQPRNLEPKFTLDCRFFSFFAHVTHGILVP